MVDLYGEIEQERGRGQNAEAEGESNQGPLVHHLNIYIHWNPSTQNLWGHLVQFVLSGFGSLNVEGGGTGVGARGGLTNLSISWQASSKNT